MFARLTFACVSLVSVAFLIGCGPSVTRHTSYREADGDLVYVGEAYNPGGKDLYPVTVEGTFYDAAGNVLYTRSEVPCLTIIPARGFVPFEMFFTRGTPDAARVEWRVTGTPTDQSGLATGLQARLLHQRTNGSTRTVTGEIINSSANTYVRGYVCAAWRNGAGDIVRVAQAEAGGINLPPGGTLPFRVWSDPPADAQTVDFYLDAGVTLPGTPAPAIGALPGTAFQKSTARTVTLPDGQTQSLVFGEIRNSTNGPLRDLEVAATVRDAQGTLVEVAVDFACPAMVPAGGTTFASYFLTTPPGGPTQPTYKIEGRKGAADEKSLTVSVRATPGAPGFASVSGSVKNSTSSTLSYVVVCVAVYDAAGNVAGTSFFEPAIPAGGLAPGKSASFSAEVLSSPGQISAKAIASGAP